MSSLRKIRILTAIIIVGLVVSGVTAFPLLHELNLLAKFFVDTEGNLDPAGYSGLAHWILLVRMGLEDTYASYPFIAYGTDWLAFGHIVIALFFVPAYREPVRYQGVFRVGIWAALLVFPLAFVCGEIRDIPIYWRLVDCLFGVVALIPLILILALIKKLEAQGSNYQG
ncbi:MAG: hypothetical protein NWT08_07160 [Akkermansiaceae bacterium]|jgi:Na+/alanine symporter|nr:hypothetical protein [Akkermansiaceae bacterium]MDP4645894.1 hypothetical protein [Akkermansiaceae bacterium]MDP4720392.1 hypothetical protein [Akkermansiaceae bacterium]MDP4779214.1 hypothetical protein [Akkermansiaceae bacterium]MDP4848172.1 hypothetical protein [Akkermansiaceae bacterium]